MPFSIVIPAKNEEVLLPRLLASIRRQTLNDGEIIVADAHSVDRTRQMAESFGAKVVDGGLPGPGRNAGANIATGDLLIFFDADAVLTDPSFLEDCLREMRARDFDVATCGVRADQGSMMDRALHEAYNYYTRATERVLPHATGSCLFVARAAHEAIGGFDEEVVFAEDCDYVRRAVKSGLHYGILRTHKIPISTRRLDTEGRMQLTAKYIYSELRMLAVGSFKHRVPFRYDLERPVTRER